MTEKNDLKYNAWLEWVITNDCNLKCAYCWYTVNPRGNESLAEKTQKNWKKACQMGFAAAIAKTGRRSANLFFQYVLKKKPQSLIDIKRLKGRLDRTNRIFNISFAGGEPFLVPNIIEACEAVTQKHFLSFSSNLVSPKIKEFALKIDPSRVTSINASCHIKELERTGLVERYIENYLRCKNAGFNIAASVRAYPPLVPEIEKYRRYFGDRGVSLRFGMFCGFYQGKHYPESYSAEELKAFELDQSKDVAGYHSLGRLCNAGYNFCFISNDGYARPCPGVGKVMGHIYDDIQFEKKLTRCPKECCGCPWWLFTGSLFQRALEETGSVQKK